MPRVLSLENVHKQKFRADQQSVSSIDNWITAVAGNLGVDPRTIFAARLCVAELANNVIQHGFAAADDAITLTLSSGADGLDIEFQDTARAFDPTSIFGRPAHSEAYEGGRGLIILKAYASKLQYWHDGRSNHVKLTIKSSRAG